MKGGEPLSVEIIAETGQNSRDAPLRAFCETFARVTGYAGVHKLILKRSTNVKGENLR
jgi:hypothetical protein